jgi:hypothetical protein
MAGLDRQVLQLKNRFDGQFKLIQLETRDALG